LLNQFNFFLFLLGVHQQRRSGFLRKALRRRFIFWEGVASLVADCLHLRRYFSFCFLLSYFLLRKSAAAARDGHCFLEEVLRRETTTFCMLARDIPGTLAFHEGKA